MLILYVIQACNVWVKWDMPILYVIQACNVYIIILYMIQACVSAVLFYARCVMKTVCLTKFCFFFCYLDCILGAVD
jgi:hypothetical protein